MSRSSKNAKEGDDTNTRVALLEQSIGHINETLIRFEKRFDRLDEKFEKMDEKIYKMDEKIYSNFKWLMGTIISLFILSSIVPMLSPIIQKILTH